MAGSSSAGDGTPLSLRDTSPTGETPAPDLYSLSLRGGGKTADVAIPHR